MTPSRPGAFESERPLRVLIVGGNSVLSEGRGYRESPETTLEAGLIARGIEVTTRPHNWHFGQSRWDIVHVHHLAHQALIQPLVRAGSRLVFTRHNTHQLHGVRRAVLELIYRRADAVVALSEAEAEVLRKRVPSDRVVCIPNGIDGTRWPFVERTRPGPGQPWRLLFVGQLLPFKGVDVLFRALAKIGLDIPIQLDLVFHNDAQEPELRRLANDFGIEDQVTFVGRADHAALVKHYARAHGLVLPSRGAEALPSVITEALLSGVPVIASAVAGISEQLADYGTVVAPGDVEQLAHAITDQFVAYDRTLLRTFPAAERARAKYTVDVMVDGHLALYRQLLLRERRGIVKSRR